jgi:PPOX class probable F420-dependent enzyme
MLIDTKTPFGARAERRLREEPLIWLISVRSDGTPQPSPVWFYWDGKNFLIYSRPNTPKLRNIARNPKVALHLDGDGRGGDIIVVTGEAKILENAALASEVPEYLEKYEKGGYFARIRASPASFAKSYSVAVQVTPRNLRGH